jgi:hypothetical protein
VRARGNLSREEALEEYLIYRKRVRELLDMAQIARDIKSRRYEPRDLSGRGPERFSDTVRDVITGLFSSLCDTNPAALNVFDVWLVLFPEKKGKIVETRMRVEPQLELIKKYRDVVVCHANKNVRRYVQTRVSFAESHNELVGAMQAVAGLIAELIRDEATALPNLRTEVDPIVRKFLANRDARQIEKIKDYFLQEEPSG